MKLLTLLFVLSLLAAGCSAKHGYPPWAIVVENDSDQTVDAVKIRFDETELGYGTLLSNRKNTKTDSLIPAAIPEEVVVSWRSQGGEETKVKVLVKSKLPKRFSGDVVFTIKNSEMVEVSHRKFPSIP